MRFYKVTYPNNDVRIMSFNDLHSTFELYNFPQLIIQLINHTVVEWVTYTQRNKTQVKLNGKCIIERLSRSYSPQQTLQESKDKKDTSTLKNKEKAFNTTLNALRRQDSYFLDYFN